MRVMMSRQADLLDSPTPVVSPGRPPSRAATLALDRESPLPLYAQVKRRLQAMILAGETGGDRFFSESELCKLFGISRATVRQALAELSSQGWIHTQRGRGSFVNPVKIDEAFGPSMNFIDQWARVGRPLSFALARFELAPVPDAVAAAMHLEPGTVALCLERVRTSGGVTVSYDYRYIHPDFAATIDHDEAASRSLLELLGRCVRLVRGENRVEAALALPEDARLLGIAAGDPILVREVVYFCGDGIPAMVGRSLYRASEVRYRFSVDLTRQDGAGDDPLPVQAELGPQHSARTRPPVES